MPSPLLRRLKFGWVWLLLNMVGTIGFVLVFAIIVIGLLSVAALTTGAWALAIKAMLPLMGLFALFLVCNALIAPLQRNIEGLRTHPTCAVDA